MCRIQLTYFQSSFREICRAAEVSVVQSLSVETGVHALFKQTNSSQTRIAARALCISISLDENTAKLFCFSTIIVTYYLFDREIQHSRIDQRERQNGREWEFARAAENIPEIRNSLFLRLLLLLSYCRGGHFSREKHQVQLSRARQIYCGDRFIASATVWQLRLSVIEDGTMESFARGSNRNPRSQQCPRS